MDFDALCSWLTAASPEYRQQVVACCLNRDLVDARCAYQGALAAGEQFKADLVRRNGRETTEIAARAAASVQRALEALDTWRAVGLAAVRLAGQATSDVQVLDQARRQLTLVSGSWNKFMPGLARGRGITGYDTPEGVAQVRKEIEEEHRALMATQVKGEEALDAQAPARDALRENEERLNKLQAQAVAAEAAAKKPPPAPRGQGGLFNQ